eukprot:m.324147 g.324147  ORF g.324147 m.324147 type:complete len:898 (-) comp16540_c10_seq17:239-2932(-)
MFKGPKAHKPERAAVVQPSQKNLEDEMGFDSDDDVSDDHEEENEEEEEDGVSFVEYITLQKSLRAVTQQRIDLGDQIRELNVRMKRAEHDLKQNVDMSRKHLAILQNAQQKQLTDKDELSDNLKIAVDEMEESGGGGDEKTQGVRNMVDSIGSLTNEKRDYFERAEVAEMKLKKAEEDLEEYQKIWDEAEKGYKLEIRKLRSGMDPDKLVRIQINDDNGASSAEVAMLNEEITSLKDKIEIMEAQKESANANAANVSNAQVERMDKDLKEKQVEIQRLQKELQDFRAQIAKMEAISASGSENDAAAKAAQKELSDQHEETSKKLREQTALVEKLQQDLKSEQEANQGAQKELDDLRQNLAETSAAGSDAASQMQAALASEKSGHASAKAKAESLGKELEETREELSKLKGETGTIQEAHEKELREMREQHAERIQAARADQAAAVAEVKQRAEDDMKDLKSRLGSFGTIVEPMIATVKTLAGNYRKLRTETRELAATIAPAVKQCKRDLLKALVDIDKQYKDMLVKYRKEMQLRKKLHNELVDLKGNIRVFGRLRPIIEEDGKGKQAEMVCTHDKTDDQLIHVLNNGKMSKFELDTVFSPESQQEDVHKACADLIVSVIDGYNVCIFAYGQTGSGKTFTMEGSKSNPGLNKRALAHLFGVAEEKKGDWSYEFEVSVMEIYNEKLRDLFNKDKKAAALEIKHGKSGPHVPGLITRPVRNSEEVVEYFNEAKSIRATATTSMNEQSSRSHCLLVVYVRGTNLSTGVQSSGKLNLIDLAGSERVSKSGAIDDAVRLKEATNINKSLSSLGDVIHALGAKQKHIPYRNSKLTHLLQDSLGGNAKCLMVVQISPVSKNVQESVCSLNFAQRVRSVELGAAKKTTESAEVAQLKKKIRELEGR